MQWANKVIRSHSQKDVADSYASLLRQCNSPAEGRRLQQQIAEANLESDTFVGNHLVRMFGSFGSLQEARTAFAKILKPNVFSWTILLSAVAVNGHLQLTKLIFNKMPARNAVSWTTMLVASSEEGCIAEAQNLFDETPERDAVSWNSLISAYDKDGDSSRAIRVFQSMLLDGTKPSEVSLVCALEACANLKSLNQGKQLHSWIREAGLDRRVKLGNALVHMYGQCGCLLQARNSFDDLQDLNIVSWNAMILAFIVNDQPWEAVKLFRNMADEADEVTLMSIAEACGALSDRETSELVHKKYLEKRFESDLKVATALVSMHGKCGQIEKAEKIFKRSGDPDVVLHTAMLTAYAQNGHNKLAIQWLKKMDLEGVTPNKVTLLCVLEICGTISALDEGRALHRSIPEFLRNREPKLWNVLLSMYGKCGSLACALSVFQEMTSFRDVVSWNTLFTAFAENKQAFRIVELFKTMQLDGIIPNAATFTCILAACSHAGLTDDARNSFVSISGDYGLETSVDHLRCMVDLLGRAGLTEEAESFIAEFGMSSDDISWNTLLAACRMHDELDRGARAAEGLAVADPENSASYLVLSKLCYVSSTM